MTDEQFQQLLGLCPFCEIPLTMISNAYSSSMHGTRVDVSAFCGKCGMEKSLEVPNLTHEMLSVMNQPRASRPVVCTVAEPITNDARVLVSTEEFGA